MCVWSLFKRKFTGQIASFVKMRLNKTDVVEISRSHPHICEYFKDNSARKNLFLATCYQLGAVFDLEDVSEECPHGGLIGIGDSKLEKYFRKFKVFRLHAALHDASGYMKQRYNVGPGYVYAVSCPVSNCLIGHVTGLSFCVYLKLFAPSLYHCLAI